MTIQAWLPPDGSLHGAMLDRLLHWNLATLGALLVLAHLILAYALVRRPGPTPERADSTKVPDPAAGQSGPAPSQSDPGAGRSEGDARFTGLLPSFRRAETWPLVLCCLLFGAMAISSERLWALLRYEGAAPSAMQVEVVGVQFQWYFRYPGGDARFGLTRPRLVNAAAGNPLGLDPQETAAQDDIVSSVLVLPVGREVDLRLRAHDVIHGFFIPGMRLKENAVPGLVLHVHFTPVTDGTYPILCTQVCGSGHARMQAVLRVVSTDEYATWLAGRERVASSATQRGQQ